jgi:hypothetical protein
VPHLQKYAARFSARLSALVTLAKHLENEAMVAGLAEVGTTAVGFGVETVTDDRGRLRLAPPKIHAVDLAEVGCVLRRHGIEGKAYTQLGLPHQGRADVLFTHRYRLDLGFTVRPTGATPFERLRHMPVEELDRMDLAAWDRKSFYDTSNERARVMTTPTSNQNTARTNRVPVITLPPPDLVRQSAVQPYPAAAREVLKPLVEGQLPPAGGGTAARIKQLMKAIEDALDPEQTAEVPDRAAPETEPGVLSDTYFGIARDSSGCPFSIQAKAALRALHSALADIDRHGTTLSEVELGNLFKLPLVLALLATEPTTPQETN